ncbi:MAG: YfiR family protein [Desulfobacteria bacterium]
MEGHERKFSGKSYVILFRMAVAVLFFVGLLPLSVLAGPVPGESEVKAVFVLNFIKFVEWPASAFLSPEDPIVLSLLGNDPTEAVLASLDGMKASGRRVVVRKVPSLSALGRCHVLYVGRSVKKELPAILAVVQRRPVLTIADFEEFPGRGGTIGIIRQDDRVGFEINEEAARKAGLKVNAKLLYLGKRTRALQGGER